MGKEQIIGHCPACQRALLAGWTLGFKRRPDGKFDSYCVGCVGKPNK